MLRKSYCFPVISSAAIFSGLAFVSLNPLGMGAVNADVETINNVILSGNIVPNPTFAPASPGATKPASWGSGGNYSFGSIYDTNNYIAPGATDSVAVTTGTGSYSFEYSQWYSPTLQIPSGAGTLYLSFFYESLNVPTNANSYVSMIFNNTSGGTVFQPSFTGTQSTWKNFLGTINLANYPGATSFHINISSNTGDSSPESPTPEFWVEDLSVSTSSTLIPVAPVPEPRTIGAVAATLVAAGMGITLLRRRNLLRAAS